jgi:hypothetical protein
MSSPEDREKRRRTRNRKFLEKRIRRASDRHGAFSPKMTKSNKKKIKRISIEGVFENEL